MIDAADIEIIKKVVYGTGGGGGFTITRREAELLFELNNATAEKENAPAWRELFVNAVGNYLMFSHGAPNVVAVEEAKRTRKWMDERSSGIQSFFKHTRTISIAAEREAAEREEAARTVEDAARDSRRREAIDQAEAAWLIERITEDDVMHDNEKALLARIRQIASEIHPSLLPFMEKYGV